MSALNTCKQPQIQGFVFFRCSQIWFEAFPHAVNLLSSNWPFRALAAWDSTSPLGRVKTRQDERDLGPRAPKVSTILKRIPGHARTQSKAPEAFGGK